MGGSISASIKTERQPASHKGLNSKVGGILNGLRSKASPSSSYELLTSRTEDEFIGLKCFTLTELKKATRNFAYDCLVSKGCVTKGWIDEHTFTPTKPGIGLAIAVKWNNKFLYSYGKSEWLTKIYNLWQLQHPNIVKLIGYCLEDVHWFLVYEYLARGSLDNHLFRRLRGSNSPTLPWKARLKIALDVAKGLAFLHSNEVEVIHVDLKTSKILIDYNYNAKLSVIGLTKDEQDMEHRVMEDDVEGYKPPEYFHTGRKTKTGDVYSFGVVLLEIMLGEPAYDENRPIEKRCLVYRVKPFLTNKHTITQIIDSRIKGQYSLREAMKVADLVNRCLSEVLNMRPNINELVYSLEKLKDSNDTIGGLPS